MIPWRRALVGEVLRRGGFVLRKVAQFHRVVFRRAVNLVFSRRAVSIWGPSQMLPRRADVSMSCSSSSSSAGLTLTVTVMAVAGTIGVITMITVPCDVLPRDVAVHRVVLQECLCLF
jgi:hypothetical protein